MICKYCKKPMECVKTFRDVNKGGITGLFTCECKKFKENALTYEEVIERLNSRLQ